MARVYRERRVYPQPQSEVRQVAERAVYELGLAVKPDATEWQISASRSMSTLSWGERLTVQMATSPGGGTQVVAESKLVFGFVDWGRNRTNVEALLASMDDVLGPGERTPLEP